MRRGSQVGAKNRQGKADTDVLIRKHPDFARLVGETGKARTTRRDQKDLILEMDRARTL